ncbi:hypothetical protein J437_LFUL015791 [Ladona fulva]|uniref:Fanconi Anaemia group E protein C-terminal domain-containing protein n=1 Tax=Ladona fulva TaxID=123851 RepID=A0A8K0P812_LADFU|nr:hypothetical protein J437_LFUL015791 [Ladona fulva]
MRLSFYHLFNLIVCTLSRRYQCSMNFEEKSEWGKWNFTSHSQDKLTLLRSYFKCTSCKSLVCEEISDKSWRILVRESLIRNRTLNETTDVSTSSKELVDNLLVIDSLNKLDECKPAIADVSDILLEDESDKLKVGGSSYTILTSEKYLDELDGSINDEALASVEDCCTLLKKGTMEDFLHKFKGKDLHKTLKLLKQNLSTEEGIANLILSICSPEKDDILEQSRWAPVLLQQLILPEMLQRDLPISRVLAVSIIQLASSFPDASVQLLCIPLLVEPLENKSLALSSPVEEILRDVIEKSFQQQQRMLQRDLPISRVLAVSIIQLASSFPDASVQLLCIPLLVEPLENKSLALSSPVEEILRDVIEKSFQQQQRVSLFR